jgi:dihydroflavonol-4-reductase
LKVDTVVAFATIMSAAAGKTIFVTGVNGHIGNHIVADLLSKGYNVKGSVRDLSDPNKVDHVIAHANKLDCQQRLQLVEGDVLNSDGWEQHLAGCDGLFHTATIYATSGDGQLIIDTANIGTDNLLNAAAKAGINRVVYTSSVAAVGSEPKGKVKDHTHWQTNTSMPYVMAKTESEKHAWKLAKQLNLDLRVINPSGVLGGGFSRPTPSTDIIGDALAGKFPMTMKIPMAFVHVKDVAIAHRRAFEVDEASGRFILAPHNNTTVAALHKRTRELYPKSKSPKLALQNWMLPLAVFQDWVGAIFTKKRVLTRQIAKGIMRGDADYDSTPATEVLGIDWIDVDTTIKDTVEAYQ